MDRYQRRRALGLVIVGIAVLSLLILTASGARSLPGTTRSLALSWTIDVIQVIQVGVGLAILGAILWGVVAQNRKRHDDKPRRKGSQSKKSSWAVLLVLAALALLVYLIPRQAASVLEESPPEFTISEVDFLRVEDVGAAWPLLVLVVVVAVAAGAVHLLTRPEKKIDGELDPGALLVEALTEALDELSWSADPRSVIIKAYLAIETALGDAGMPRRASEAPREYLHRILTAARVDQDSITRLTALFELARFSEHEMGAVDREDAIQAMESVRAELGASQR